MAVSAFLRQGTAVTRPIGPFVDELDGNTPETGLTITAADVLLSKNGGTPAAKQEPSTSTHQAQGIYACALSAADVDTLGSLSLYVRMAGALYVRHDYMVMPAPAYDAMFGAEPFVIDTDALLDAPNMIHGYTLRAALSIIAGLVAGLVSGARTGTETFRGLDGITTVAVIEADAQGNRTQAQYLP